MSRTYRRALMVLIALVLAVGTGGMSATAAPAPAQPGGGTLSNGAPDIMAAAAFTPTLHVRTPKGDRAAPCSAVRAHLKDYLAPGQKTVLCSSVAPASRPAAAPQLRTGTAGGATPLTPFANPLAQCSISAAINSWVTGRMWGCIDIDELWVYTYDTQGALLGRALYQVRHGYGLDARSATWTNWSYFYLELEDGAEPATTVGSTVICTGPCATPNSGDPIGGLHTLGVMNAVYGDSPFAAAPPPGGIVDGLGATWTDTFQAIGASPGVLTYSTPVFIRCDAQANTGAAQGCAVPIFLPTLLIKGRTLGNASAEFVRWFQASNNDHWGLKPTGTPLSRLNNPIAVAVNRSAMCGSGAFTADPAVPTDSCDEFPFAGTYQSGGAMFGLFGAACAQATFTFEPSTNSWTDSPSPGYSPTQRCALGHVPLADNQSVGGMYSSFIKNNRVLDKDKFWIKVQ